MFEAAGPESILLPIHEPATIAGVRELGARISSHPKDIRQKIARYAVLRSQHATANRCYEGMQFCASRSCIHHVITALSRASRSLSFKPLSESFACSHERLLTRHVPTCAPNAQNVCMHVWHNMSSHGTTALQGVLRAGFVWSQSRRRLVRKNFAKPQPFPHIPTHRTTMLSHCKRGSGTQNRSRWRYFQDLKSPVRKDIRVRLPARPWFAGPWLIRQWIAARR